MMMIINQIEARTRTAMPQTEPAYFPAWSDCDHLLTQY